MGHTKQNDLSEMTRACTTWELVLVLGSSESRAPTTPGIPLFSPPAFGDLDLKALELFNFFVRDIGIVGTAALVAKLHFCLLWKMIFGKFAVTVCLNWRVLHDGDLPRLL